MAEFGFDYSSLTSSLNPYAGNRIRDRYNQYTNQLNKTGNFQEFEDTRDSDDEPKYRGTTKDLTLDPKEAERAKHADRIEVGLGVIQGVGKILNAIENYNQLSDSAALNKRLIDSDIARLGEDIETTKNIGKQAALREGEAGRRLAVKRKLSSVAQGQKIGSAGARRISESHQIVAATRASEQENVALSKALGLEYEQISLGLEKSDIDRKKRLAKVNRNLGIVSGLINLGSSGLGLYNTWESKTTSPGRGEIPTGAVKSYDTFTNVREG